MDVYVHGRRNGTSVSDSLWIIGGVTTVGTTGDSYFDFELYQSRITQSGSQFINVGPDEGHTAWTFNPNGTISSPGDLIVAASFSNTGLNSLEVRIWVKRTDVTGPNAVTPQRFNFTGVIDGGSSNSTYVYATISPKPGSGTIYTGFVNTAPTTASPWGQITSTENYTSDYSTNQLLEFSLNLTALGVDPGQIAGRTACDPAFQRFMAKTRSSSSFTSELKDYAGPNDFLGFPAATLDLGSNRVLCESEYPATVTVNVTNTSEYSNPTLSWTASNGGSISGTTSGTAITALTPGTYTVTAISYPGCPNIDQKSINLSIKPTPVINSSTPVSQSVCNNQATAPVSFTSGATLSGSPTSFTGTITYNYSNPDPTIGLPASATGLTSVPSFNAVNSGTATKTVVITVTPVLNGCLGTPVSLTYTIFPTPTVNAVTSATYCAGATVPAINFSSPTAGTVFSYTSTTNIGFGTTGSGNINSFTAVNTTTAPITATVTVRASINGCVGPAQLFTIRVNPSPTVNAISSVTYCHGATASPIVFGSNIVGSTFSYTSTANVGFATTASSTTGIASFVASNTTTAPISATVTVVATATGCSGPAQTFTVTVYPRPTVNAVTSATYCAGATVPAINFSSPVAGATFSYTSTADIGFGTTGTGNINSFTAINNSTAPVTATITVVASSGGCAGAAQTFTIRVNPSPVVGAISSVTYCNGATASAIPFNSSLSGTTFVYTSSANVGFPTSGTTTTGISSFVATNTTTAPITATVNVVGTANGCSGSAQVFTITVYPTPTVNAVTSATYCAGATVPAINFNSPVAGATFSYTSTADIGFGTAGTGNISSFTAINNTTAPITATITVVASANGCAGTPQTFTIRVNPSPVVSSVGSVTYCNGATASAINFSSPTAGTVFNYTSTVNVGFGTSGTGNIASFTAVNAGVSPVVALLTVTGTANGCTGPATSFSVTVNPSPVVNSVNNLTVCNGASVSAIPFSSPTAGTTFSYTVSNNIGFTTTATSVTGIASFVASNTTATPINATVTVVGTANGCSGPAQTFTIQVNPSPAVNTTATSATYTNGAIVPSITFTSATTGATFTYTSSVDIGFGTSGSGNIPSFTATNGTLTRLTATISVTATAAGCAGPATSLTITVLPNPPVANPDASTTAQGTPVSTTVLANDFANGNAGFPASTANVSVTVTSGPLHGSAVPQGNGTILYTPAAGYSGPDSYTYTICSITEPNLCATTTVSLQVIGAISAVPDASTTAQGTSVTTVVLSNDVVNSQPASATNVTVSVTTQPAHGTAVVNPSTGAVVYTPAAGYSGLDSYTYTICSTVQPSLCATTTVSLTVVGAISAQPDNSTTAQGTPVTTVVLANDNVNGSPASATNVTVSVTTQPAHGTAVVNPSTGEVVYTPAAGYSGLDSYTYTICSTVQPSLCATTTVSLTVVGAISAQPDNSTTAQGTPVTTVVLANDNVNGSPASATNVTVSVTTQPAHGTAVVNPSTGEVVYTPAAGYSGPDSYTYTICSTVQPSL
ncbi:beta strand repeat-containing protein, partial [Nibrella viscosa]|uniref:beta strand repeat-containing protein n=1 Tax=Nibrella viscosa TaxID=1084524 RepID=UPI0031ED6D85